MAERLDLEEIEKACVRAGTGELETRRFSAMALGWLPSLVARCRELEAELSRRNDALATLTRLDERERCALIAESYEP